MRVISLFSGVGGIDLGLEQAGMTTVAQVEIDSKCQQVLQYHWPDVPKWTDVVDVHGVDLPTAELVAFGSPCQDLSNAGTRNGFAGKNSGLFYEAIRVIQEMINAGRGPRWVLWENVPGALYSTKGRDFAKVIDFMAQLGAVAIEWRVLDAQYFGVPQRRRRVFLVACFDPRITSRPQIFPHPQGSPRNTEQSLIQKQKPTGSSKKSPGEPGPLGNPVLVSDPTQITHPENRSNPKIGDPCHTLPKQAKPPHVIGFHLRQDPISQPGKSPCLGVTSGGMGVYIADFLRRLTPRECERLMGWPDDWTLRGADGTAMSDTRRYGMCGNGAVSSVVRWVGEQILVADSAL